MIHCCHCCCALCSGLPRRRSWVALLRAAETTALGAEAPRAVLQAASVAWPITVTGCRSYHVGSVGSQEWSFVAFVVRITVITGWNLQCKTHHSNLICGIVQDITKLFSIFFDFDLGYFSFIFSRPSTQPRWCFSRSASICCGRSGGVSQWYPSAMVAWDRVWHSGCHARLIFTEILLNIFLIFFVWSSSRRRLNKIRYSMCFNMSVKLKCDACKKR